MWKVFDLGKTTNLIDQRWPWFPEWSNKFSMEQKFPLSASVPPIQCHIKVFDKQTLKKIKKL